MQRLVLLGSVAGTIALAMGCDAPAEQFNYQSTLHENTRGVVVGNDGRAQVGLDLGTTCEVDTQYASMSTDYDYPGDDESVDDIDDRGEGDVRVVVTSEKGAHIQTEDGFWGGASEDYEVPNAVQSRLLDVGAAVLYNDGGYSCGVEWVGGAVDARAPIKGDQCDDITTMSVDPVVGTAFIGGSNGVTAVTPDGTTAVVTDEQSELSEWDATTEVLYVAALGSSTVRGYEADGTELWTASVDGSITGLDDMGLRAAVAVSIQLADGSGGVRVLDGATGEPLEDIATPTPADAIRVSDDGRSLALVEEGQVHFYDRSAPGGAADDGDSDFWDAVDLMLE